MAHRYAVKVSHRTGTLKGTTSYFFRDDCVVGQNMKPPLNDEELYNYIKISQRTQTGSDRRFRSSSYYDPELLSYQVVTLGKAIEEWRSHWRQLSTVPDNEARQQA